MATPVLADQVQIAAGSADQIDSVMRVMDAAFGDRFGEAWTRSQLSGILPMAGVMLTLALDRASRTIIGFSLIRTVAGESELLLIGVSPAVQPDGVTRVHLEVRDGNPAIGMYRAAGFSQAGRRRNYYHATDGNRYDAITLACEL